MTQIATANSRSELTNAARISRRYRPNVCGEVTVERRCSKRVARLIAASAIPMPITSVSMWPASESNASELVAKAATNWTTKNTAMIANAAIRRPR